jgi:hypothetical protein
MNFSVQHGKLHMEYLQIILSDWISRVPTIIPTGVHMNERLSAVLMFAAQRYSVLQVLPSDGIIALYIFEGSVTKGSSSDL